jgi:xanthine dehydrogenase YagS FAD-binding subunit
MAPALVALNAGIVIVGSEGERRIALRDLFVGPDNLRETILKPDEFLLAVEVPDHPGDVRQIFFKQRIRHAADFALASVAAVARMSGGVCEEARLVLGGVAPFPYVAKSAEKLLKGQVLTEHSISEAAEAALEGAKPLPMNRYKIDLTTSIVRNALTSIIETD